MFRISVNFEDRGYFFEEVVTKGSVCVIVDIYANTVSAECVGESFIYFNLVSQRLCDVELANGCVM